MQGFYTKDQLALLIQRRTSAQPLAEVRINTAIVNRYYQDEAIRQMSEHFTAKHRKGLLVMATGTGKTRVAIALVDLLMRADWVKRVLFLADRTALVRRPPAPSRAHLPASNPVNLLEPTAREQAPERPRRRLHLPHHDEPHRRSQRTTARSSSASATSTCSSSTKPTAPSTRNLGPSSTTSTACSSA